ncbi:MAG: hypothetical protein GF333_04550 [Candidatus Omnitrophica bacterium]|nr:hypothetical protein [Candidatus Omnitrophota bacterium]
MTQQIPQTERLLKYFSLLKQRKRLNQSMLFVGDNEELMLRILQGFACEVSSFGCGTCWDCRKMAEGRHPDLKIIAPDPHTIKIQSIRESREFLSLRSFRIPLKILKVNGGECFSAEAANAFLKTLEEPPGHSCIMVCAAHTEGILPTILSRCRKVFLPEEVREVGAAQEASDVASFLRGHRKKFKKRQEFMEFLRCMIQCVHAHLCARYRKNNSLRESGDCEIILRSYTTERLMALEAGMLRVAAAADTVNMNLAQNIIQSKI